MWQVFPFPNGQTRTEFLEKEFLEEKNEKRKKKTLFRIRNVISDFLFFLHLSSFIFWIFPSFYSDIIKLNIIWNLTDVRCTRNFRNKHPHQQQQQQQQRLKTWIPNTKQWEIHLAKGIHYSTSKIVCHFIFYSNAMQCNALHRAMVVFI